MPNPYEKYQSKALEHVKSLYHQTDPLGDASIDANIKSMWNSWLTRQYFSLGRNAVVLPAWLLEQLGPDGNGRHGFAGLPIVGNTDHRNYYALGNPKSTIEPVIDHRGGIIPKPNSYTLMFGTIVNNVAIYTSEAGDISVKLHEKGYPILTVEWSIDDDKFIYECVAHQDDDNNEILEITILRGFANHQLLITLTPLDQDKLTKIPEIRWEEKANKVIPKNHPPIIFSENPVNSLILPAERGHAGKLIQFLNVETTDTICNASAASWAASFPVRSNIHFTILLKGEDGEAPDSDDIEDEWEEDIEDIPIVHTGNEEIDKLFINSAITLRLLVNIENAEVTMGPSLQEKLWIPALIFQLQALDRLGYKDIVREVLNKLLEDVSENGFDHANGQWEAHAGIVIAIANHYYQYKDTQWLGNNFTAVRRIADYLVKMRKKYEDDEDVRKQGLLPPGNALFFDPLFWRSGHYYSQNFWANAALYLVADLGDLIGRKGEAEKTRKDAEQFQQVLENNISIAIRAEQYLPAGPYLQENASMIFNLFAFYPFELFKNNYQPLIATLNWIWNNYTFNGGFLMFQPWNAYGSYLTMQLAQNFRYVEEYEKIEEIINFLVKNKTNDSGWAEGISPLSRSGSVGDCPNGFSAAEWINLILDLFVDEKFGRDLVLLKGMPLSWLEKGVSLSNLNVEGEAKLSLEAKLTKNILEVSFEYTGIKSVYFAAPIALKKFPSKLKQISTNFFKIDKKIKSFAVTLDI